MSRPPQWLKRFAVPLADKIVYASSAYVSVKSTLNGLSSSLITFEGQPSGEADARLLEFARMLRPYTSEHLELVRIGARTDGGYVMANPIRAEGALSIGVGSDVSWDADIGSRGIPVAMFDHTVRRPPAIVPNGTFHRVGIAPLASTNLQPLSALINLTGFPPFGDLLLKIDVEGAEWRSLSLPGPADLGRFSQIVLELHNLSELKSAQSAPLLLETLRTITSTHYPIHVHANNYDELVHFNEWWFPNAIELSLIRKELLPGATPSTRLAIELDAPCDPRVADIDLSALTKL